MIGHSGNTSTETRRGGGPHGLSPSLPRGFSRFPLNRRFLEPGDTSKHSARVLRSLLLSSISQNVGFRAQNGPGFCFPCPSTWRQFLDLLQDHLPRAPDKQGRHQRCLIGYLGHGFNPGIRSQSSRESPKSASGGQCGQCDQTPPCDWSQCPRAQVLAITKGGIAPRIQVPLKLRKT